MDLEETLKAMEATTILINYYATDGYTFKIADISNPLSIKQQSLSWKPISARQNMNIFAFVNGSGSRAYVELYPHIPYTGPDYKYYYSIVDSSDFDHPKFLAENIEGRFSTNVFSKTLAFTYSTKEDTAVSGNYTTTIGIVDWKNANQPQQLGKLALAGVGLPFFASNNLYVISNAQDGTYLYKINFEDPSTLWIAEQSPISSIFNNTPNAEWHGYLLFGKSTATENPDGSFNYRYQINVLNPSNPLTDISSIDLPNDVYDFFVSGDTLVARTKYQSGALSGIRLMKLSLQKI